MSDGAYFFGGYEHGELALDLDSMELPISICDVEESLAGWPFRRPREEPEPSEAMRLLGHEICQESRRHDLAALKRAYNRRDDE